MQGEWELLKNSKLSNEGAKPVLAIGLIPLLTTLFWIMTNVGAYTAEKG